MLASSYPNYPYYTLEGMDHQAKMEKEAKEKKIDVINAIFAVQTEDPLRPVDDSLFKDNPLRKPEYKDEVDPSTTARV